MRDYNFFEPFVDRNKKNSNANYVNYPLIIALLVVLIAALPVYNLIKSFMLDSEIQVLETEVLENPNYSLLAVADELRAGIVDGKTRLDILKSIDVALTEQEWLDESFLFSLMSTVPKDLEVKNLSLTIDQAIQISGSATNKPAIAELEYNLRNTGKFENLLVRNIVNTEAGFYDFSMTLSVKGATADETN
ncbi:PilN domain-containing protein [Acidaminobacter sp.]|uniref:PilN domain-containing protein n=1 Tax=Acidaminobacter sp. TaxID=1872102 RepID=UPI0025613533|nr:PilN domain-containing protein [Acidaminobacter sp.]MDK9712376.1 PilN domain-containing protein [Acidaminobacter sp.]